MLSIVIGIIRNLDSEIFITRRNIELHQGGLWEFAGGKVEAGETLHTALARELKEEIDIEIIQTTPLIQLKHDYSDRVVQLNVFLITEYEGEAKSLLGQETAWVKVEELENYSFLAANKTILTALRLPPYYAILNDNSGDLLAKLHHLLAQNIKLIQARLKNLTAEQAREFFAIAYPICQTYGAILLVNSGTIRACEMDCDGIHLTSSDLLALKERLTDLRWLSASCHNLEELQHAEEIGVDFAVLAPVLPTKTHPETAPLGWRVFSEWVEECTMPVYALGGLNKVDLKMAQMNGAQGIASISAFG